MNRNTRFMSFEGRRRDTKIYIVGFGDEFDLLKMEVYLKLRVTLYSTFGVRIDRVNLYLFCRILL